ncbi:conserved hypothetical protein [Culex quinquefasciatus]|uniref:Uncharacterized protein n=1 Tax=Culex quinquefasciatus TaxID=7176 RepID=B0X252_CULQU|nr:conserved hypothetical protein [Culex quinquefasciatus]|eukprot:XP_001863724.1 conserved hypothetical protein [Culex quinquefasciatus]
MDSEDVFFGAVKSYGYTRAVRGERLERVAPKSGENKQETFEMFKLLEIGTLAMPATQRAETSTASSVVACCVLRAGEENLQLIGALESNRRGVFGANDRVLLYPEEGWARSAASSYWTISPCRWRRNRCIVEEVAGSRNCSSQFLL